MREVTTTTAGNPFLPGVFTNGMVCLLMDVARVRVCLSLSRSLACQRPALAFNDVSLMVNRRVSCMQSFLP